MDQRYKGKRSVEIHGTLISCCRGCTRREIGCHSICEEYINESKAQREIFKAEQERKSIGYALKDIRTPDKYKRQR